jgi:predicted phosphohydrolase
MVIQYCSDLHLEFPENKVYMAEHPLKPAGDILLLAGDIVPLAGMDTETAFFDLLSQQFEQTYWVPGNHEYYRSDIKDRTGTMNVKLRSNVSLVNNCVITYKDVRLIFSTLWSRISPEKEAVIRQGMADFHLIKNNGSRLSIDDYHRLHAQCRAFLFEQLNKKNQHDTVVISHHVPTFLNYPEKYADSELSEGFAVELSDLIEQSDVNFWIYGHTHEVIPDFMVGNTLLTTNQLGYVRFREHQKFRPDRTITIADSSG